VKLPAFDYASPASLSEAIALLATFAGAAKPIAGGQSLIPVLAFRLAQPALLVDLREVPGLNGIRIAADGVHLGAMVRWCDIEADAQLHRAQPLLVAAVAHVAHYQIRNRGTIGGSLAHADPAAELPGVAVACEAELTLVSARGSRTVAASHFFRGALSTALEDDELILEMRLPPWPPSRRFGFEEFARRRGDFAIAGIAAYYDIGEGGRAANTHVVSIGTEPCPRRLRQAEAALDGATVDADAIGRAARAARLEVEPASDLHASADYRGSLVETLVERALLQAAAHAR
jgi:carbon-monoxide dehydrogenase medium subunit